MRNAIPALKGRSLLVLAGLLGLCALVAIIGSTVTTPRIPVWYETLEKPFFTPPNWLFGPVWTVLYALMAVAAWRIWRSRAPGRRPALAVFFVQLAVNLAWSIVFFGLTSPRLGLAVILALMALILWMIALFRPIDRPAAWSMVPYAAWVAYATALNFAIAILN